MDDPAFSEYIKNTIEKKMAVANGDDVRKGIADVEHVKICLSRYRKKMESIITDSENEGVEMGMVFFHDPDEHDIGCSIGEVHSGGKHAIVLQDYLTHPSIGDFHTHPISGIAEPSPGDVYNSIRHRRKFFCIGNAKEGIRCYSVDWSAQDVIDVERMGHDTFALGDRILPIVRKWATELYQGSYIGGPYEYISGEDKWALEDAIGIINIFKDHRDHDFSDAYKVALDVAPKDTTMLVELEAIESDMGKYIVVRDKFVSLLNKSYKHMYFEHDI